MAVPVSYHSQGLDVLRVTCLIGTGSHTLDSERPITHVFLRKLYTTIPVGVYTLEFPGLNTNSVHLTHPYFVVPTSPYLYLEPFPGAFPLSQVGGEGYLRTISVRILTLAGVEVPDPTLLLELGLQHPPLPRR